MAPNTDLATGAAMKKQCKHSVTADRQRRQTVQTVQTDSTDRQTFQTDSTDRQCRQTVQTDSADTQYRHTDSAYKVGHLGTSCSRSCWFGAWMLMARVDCRLWLASFMMALGTPTVLMVMCLWPTPRFSFSMVWARMTDGRLSNGSPMPMKTAVEHTGFLYRI